VIEEDPKFLLSVNRFKIIFGMVKRASKQSTQRRKREILLTNSNKTVSP
jgi:hypothetical protein